MRLLLSQLASGHASLLVEKRKDKFVSLTPTATAASASTFGDLERCPVDVEDDVRASDVLADVAWNPPAIEAGKVKKEKKEKKSRKE